MAANVSGLRRGGSIISSDLAPTTIIAIALTIAACGRPGPDPETAAPTVGGVVAPVEGDASRSPVASPIAREPLRLAELAVADLTPADTRVPGFDTSAETAIQAAFIDPAHTFARAAADDPGACRAAIRIGYALMVNGRPVADADAGSARAVIQAELFCPLALGDPSGSEVEEFRITVEDERPFGGTAGGTGRGRLEDGVRQVARAAAEGLFGQARTRHQDDATILANLATQSDGTAAAHDGILSESASEAGERHLVKAVPDLVRLTAHPNTRVAVRAGAALGQLKVDDPDVLRALVRMTEGPNPQRHLVAIHALADLGTAEARRYLDNLATGHPLAAIRELARERLRTADDPGATPSDR